MEQLFNLNDIVWLTCNDAEDVRIVYLQAEHSLLRTKINLLYNMICFSIEGVKCIKIHRSKIWLKAGSFALVQKGTYLQSSQNICQDGTFRGIYILFNDKAITDFFLKHPELRNQKIAHTKYLKRHFVCAKDEFIQDYFLPSLQYVIEGQGVLENIGQIKFEEVMLYLCSKYPEKNEWFNTILNNQNTLVQRVVENHLYDHSTISELAFLCNLSISTFKRHFIQIYKMPPQKYLIEKKMKRAVVLLQNEHNELLKAYSQLGYNTMGAFVKTFKKYYGITPAEYKKQLNR